jgi:predicted O-methyltransferase YrrM
MADNSQASFAKILRYCRQNGLPDTMSRGSTAVLQRLFGKALRKRTQPTYREFREAGGCTSATELLVRRFPSAREQVQVWTSEFNEALEELRSRHSRLALRYGENYGIDPEAGLLIYAVIRALRPTTMLETGVANGDSTFFVLNALQRNGCGTLHSVEVDSAAGVVLESAERSRWQLHVLKGDNFRLQFARIISELPPIHVFMHDSDHWYDWHLFELESVLPHMSAVGVILSDDIADSPAFFDFCVKHNLIPSVLLGRRPFGAVLSLNN